MASGVAGDVVPVRSAGGRATYIPADTTPPTGTTRHGHPWGTHRGTQDSI